MRNMNKILAVSLIAVAAVSSANAKIVSETLLTATPGTYTSTNTVQAAIADAKKAGTDAAALAVGKVGSVTTGSANGTISVDSTDVAVKGLKSAAYTESSAYATAAQGTLADNAVPNTRKVAGHALSSDVTLSKSDVGLGNVDNTSDANKPISTATQTALNAKQDKAMITVVNDNFSTDGQTAASIEMENQNSRYLSGAAVAKYVGETFDERTGTLNSAIAALQDNKENVGVAAGLINDLDLASVGGNGTVIKTVSQTNGKLAATAGAIVNADISSSAAIAPSKIATDASNRFVTDTEKSGWSGKQAALSTEQLAAANSGITSGKVSTYDGYATGKQNTLIASGTGQNIQGSGSVTVSKDASTGMITINGTDNNTTYSTGTTSTAGLTKLYTGTGSNTDGTMTQSAITSALGSKQASITSSAKLGADLVDDTNATHKFVTSTEKSTWSGKQDALTSTQLAAANSGITSGKVSTYDGYASGKQNTLVASGTGQNIQGSGSVTVSKDASTGMITINGTDNNTTYSTGTTSTAGLTKLYTGTGSNTDGTMTQNAITTALNGKGTLKKASDYENSISILENENFYLSAPATLAVITDELDTRQQGWTNKGSASLPVYFDNYGVAQTITSYEGTAENAKNIPVKSGSTITSYAAIWVE